MIRERRERKAEKERLEQIAAKMSAKKLQRMKKVSGLGGWLRWKVMARSLEGQPVLYCYRLVSSLVWF